MLLAEAAEKNRPQLAQFDAYGEDDAVFYSDEDETDRHPCTAVAYIGRRIDVVNYHEAYHALMTQGEAVLCLSPPSNDQSIDQSTILCV